MPELTIGDRLGDRPIEVHRTRRGPPVDAPERDGPPPTRWRAGWSPTHSSSTTTTACRHP
jgi:hypothetical protein